MAVVDQQDNAKGRLPNPPWTHLEQLAAAMAEGTVKWPSSGPTLRVEGELGWSCCPESPSPARGVTARDTRTVEQDGKVTTTNSDMSGKNGHIFQR